jgi:hypothetical protein
MFIPRPRERPVLRKAFAAELRIAAEDEERVKPVPVLPVRSAFAAERSALVAKFLEFVFKFVTPRFKPVFEPDTVRLLRAELGPVPVLWWS